MQAHTGIISTQTDGSPKKIAVIGASVPGLLMIPYNPEFTIEHTTDGVSGVTDDVQTLTLAPAGTKGNWRLNIAGKTTPLLTWQTSAAVINTKLAALGITDTVASGGPLGTNPIILTTTQQYLPTVFTSEDTLQRKPFKWIPTINEIEFSEAISASLYTTTPMRNQWAFFLSGVPTSGTTTFNVTTPAGTQATGPIGIAATAADLTAAMASVTAFNPANYEVIGGPWPKKALVMLFKNELQFNQPIFTVGTNGFNNSGLPKLYPIGKQIMVAYHPRLKQHIVIRPGYV